jgi:acylphosphatase
MPGHGATFSGTDGGDPVPTTRLEAVVHGHVQGVGFRWSTRTHALALGLTGSAVNLPDGRVRVVAEGPAPAAAMLWEWLRTGAPGRVDEVTARWGDPRGERGFGVG